jgi:uncharacterized protein YndB with AHSA1/START domain
MNKMHFEIQINAPKEKVWDVMLGNDTYPQWTDVFMPGSNFEGSWDEGSKILFTAPDENGKKGGMVARIVENRPHEFISIEHVGQLIDGIEDTESEEVKQWAGAHEDYTFEDSVGGGGTTVHIDVDVPDTFKDDMAKLWPQALEKLKQIAEQ